MRRSSAARIAELRRTDLGTTRKITVGRLGKTGKLVIDEYYNKKEQSVSLKNKVPVRSVGTDLRLCGHGRLRRICLNQAGKRRVSMLGNIAAEGLSKELLTASPHHYRHI